MSSARNRASFQDLLVCGICLEKYNDPRSLPCLHSFCTACLQNHVTLNSSFRESNSQLTFHCPTCREEIVLPREGVTEFRRDFKICQVSALFETKEHDNEEAVKSEDESVTENDSKWIGNRDSVPQILCEVCLQKKITNSLYFCRDCDKLICSPCRQKHDAIDVFKDHSVRETQVPPHWKRDGEYCTVHQSEKCEYVCKDCTVPICGLCVINQHGTHVVLPSDEFLRDVSDNFTFKSKALKSKRLDLLELVNNVQRYEAFLDADHQLVASQIKRRADGIVKALHQQQITLLDVLQKRCGEEQERLRRLRTRVKTVIDKMGRAQEKASGMVIRSPKLSRACKYAQCADTMGQLLEESLLLDIEQSRLTIEFVQRGSSTTPKLGSVVFKSRGNNPTVQSTTDEHSSSVEVGLLHVDDYDSDTNTDDITRPEIVPDECEDVEPGQMMIVQPHAARVENRNLSAQRTISMQPDREMNAQVTSSFLAEAFVNGTAPTTSWPSISILDEQQPLVIGTGGRQGGEFDSPRDVTFLSSSTRFAVVDTNNDRVQIFDDRGLLAGVIGHEHGSPIKPWGVACSVHGTIAVTDNVDKCVKIYDRNFKFKYKIGSFLCPYAVEFTNTGLLLVTDFFSTNLYKLDLCGDPRGKFQYRSLSDRHACGAARIAVTHHNNVVISDISNTCIKCFNLRGQLLWQRDSTVDLLSPQGLTLTPSGDVVVADALNKCGVILDARGCVTGKIAFAGRSRVQGDPTGIAMSGDGTRLAVSYVNEHKVEILKLT